MTYILIYQIYYVSFFVRIHSCEICVSGWCKLTLENNMSCLTYCIFASVIPVSSPAGQTKQHKICFKIID